MSCLRASLVFAMLSTATVTAFADGAPPAGGGMDPTKMGPLSRLPKAEKADQKELQAWFKAYQAADDKSDLDTIVAMTDFPVLMMTDSSKGEFKSSEVTKDQYIAMMKPFQTPEAKKGMKMSGQKGTCHMISDDLASCEGEYTLAVGKVKGKINTQMIMTRIGGKWMAKSMMEAGWGDMGTGAPPAAAPAPAAGPAPAAK